MAWDPIPGGGYSGDEPLDAFTMALDRIARAYLDRFGRRPTQRELRHALDVVIQATPELYIDDWSLDTAASDPSRPTVLPDDFEASASEEPNPEGSYFVSCKAQGIDVLRCNLKLEGRRILCDYLILDTRLNDADARALVVATILHHLTNNHFADKADHVCFRPLGSSDRVTVPYPR